MTQHVNSNHENFGQLLNGLMDGQLNAEQMRHLEQQIQTNPLAMKKYIETVTLSVGLRKFSQTQREAMREALQQTPDQSALWQTLALDEKQAPAVIVTKKKKWFKFKAHPVTVQPKEENIQRVHRRISRYPITLLITATAALVLLLVYIRLFPSQTMATLSDSVDAVWDNHANEFRGGNGLYPGNGQQILKEGFAQVRFACGAEVIFEAPCMFILENKEQLYLEQGKVFVRVPKEAIGFSVRTPNCRLIDLGTEFGIMVDQDGTSRFQMFSGKASLIAGQGKEKISELLLAGQACYVEANSAIIEVASFLKGQFVQRINSRNNIIWRGEKDINLADIVVGGNGLKTESSGCLNPVTCVIAPEVKYLTPDEMRYPPLTYNAVGATPFIDGVFIPDGRNGTVQVSSEKHSFVFPKTSATIWYPITPITYYVTDKNEGSQSPGEGATALPAFYLHANLGITFDLDAIRSAYPGTKITGFRTQYGIRYDNTPHSNKVDFWVLVDGQNKYQHLAKTAGRKMEDAYIPLEDTDRFLTLATTESGDGLGYDWGVFVNPMIELTSDKLSQ